MSSHITRWIFEDSMSSIYGIYIAESGSTAHIQEIFYYSQAIGTFIKSSGGTYCSEETSLKPEHKGMYLVRNVKVKMQLQTDCGCAGHVTDLKMARMWSAGALEETTWDFQKHHEISVKSGCSVYPENSQIIPEYLVMIFLLTLFYLCILCRCAFL